MQDFLGNEYEVGDIVLYAAMSGRSVNMVKAEVLALHESGSVTVMPLNSARWKQHHGRDRYVDTRTGKTFHRYGPKAAENTVRPSGVVHKVTGQFLTSDEDYARRRADWRAYQADSCDWTYAPVIWKDYVKEEHVVSKVNLTVTENIVLLEKKNVGG